MIPTDNYLSPSAARAVDVAIKIQDAIIKQGKLYYQGGCYFHIPKEVGPQVKVVAKCEGLPVAVKCSFGEGTDNVILFSLHPEFEWSKNLERHPPLADLAKTLSEQETFREEVWDEIGRSLHLPMKSKL
jgi:glutamine amidotransferase-like uncharacterized protein